LFLGQHTVYDRKKPEPHLGAAPDKKEKGK